MEDKVKRIYDEIKYFKDNISEIWGSDTDIDEMLSENNSTRREEISKKYFSFLSEYLSNPGLIPSLKLEKLPKNELIEILIILQLFLPKNIYHDIFKYYKDKIEYLDDFTIVISKDDRVKYFEFLRNNDGTGLAQWLKDLSNAEEERMKKFGYKK